MNPHSLYDLAFGNSIAQTERSVASYQDRIGLTLGWDSSYDALGDVALFATKSASVQLNGLRLAAISHSPFRSKVQVDKTCTLVVPLAGGSSVSQVNGRLLTLTPGVSAAFAPPGERIGRGDYRSVLMVDFDPIRLQSTWEAMHGVEATHQCMPDMNTPQELSLRLIGNTVSHVCAIVDQFCQSPQTLVALGLDDLLYRNIVLMMRPDLFVAHTAAKDPFASDASRPRRALDPLCDYLLAHLGERITLTDMERISGVSSRGLQYAFLHRFGCSPLQWLRSARLEHARRHILSQGPAVNITQLAMACGFAKPSDFAEQYRRRFGELPSQTRGRI